jgi:hypothetical protein
MECAGQVSRVTYRVPAGLLTRVNGCYNDGATTYKSYVPASLDTLTQRMRSAVTSTGGSEIWNISLTVEILRSNLTGAGNAITIPVGKRVEAVRDVVVDYSSSPMIDAV